MTDAQQHPVAPDGERRVGTPIACPYCGGRIVNGVDVDEQLYPVVLDDQGGWREGSWEQGVSPWHTATAFCCLICQSVFFPPAGAKGTFDRSLDAKPYSYMEGHERGEKIGHDIVWLGVESQLLPRLIELLDTPETSVLRDRALAIEAEMAAR